MTGDDRIMVELLASARAKRRGTTTAEEMEFATKFLCLLFDPIKEAHPDHKPRAEALRYSYRGIAGSSSLQEVFRESFQPTLLASPSLADALAQPYGHLV